MFDRLDPRDLLQQIADAQSTTFVVKDLEHRFALVSEGFAASLGLTSAQMLGRDDLEVGISSRLVLGNDATEFPGFWAIDDQAIASGESQRSTEFGIQYGPGSAHEADTLRTPLRDVDGNVVGLLVQSRDMTDVTDLKAHLQENTANLERHVSHLSALDGVLAALLRQRGNIPLLGKVAEAIVSHSPADHAFVWMLHETGEYLEVVAAVGPRSALLMGRHRAMGEGFAGYAWERAETLYLSNTDLDPATRADWQSGTEICTVPLFDEQGFRGLLMACNASGGGRLEREIALLEHLANLSAVAIANARLAETTADELARTKAVSSLGRMLASVASPADDLDAVCRTLLDALDISRASIYLVDECGLLAPSTIWTSTPDGPVLGDRVPSELVPETIMQWCHDNKRAAETFRDFDDERESSRVHRNRRKLDVGASYCMPIMRGDISLGSLVVGRSRQRRNFNRSEILVIESIVGQLCLALERHELSSALHHEAYHDSLTRLPNRRSFEMEIETTLGDPERRGERGAVLFLDLDGFKLVNDTLGHAVGDSLLRQVGERLARRLDSGDVLARMGGDEFAIIARGLGDAAEAGAIARRLADALAARFDIDGVRLSVDASIGICHYPADGTSADELLRCADIAMYEAKRAGKGRIVAFESELGIASSRRAELELELRDAIGAGQFGLVYQPQVRCSDGRVAGVEALLRWTHPVRGSVSPAEFVPIAEEAGLIDRIGAWVLEEAVRELASWRTAPLDTLRMSVNIGTSQFLLDGFPEQVLATLARHDMDAGRLELEVTEGVLVRDVDTVVRHLKTLRAAGVRIAIDDFGTGYSSLSYLQELPLDVLKIDRAFVSVLQDGRTEQSLARTIQLLASGLGLESVAEGVETPEQLAAIVALGCDLVQGYHFSRPVEPAVLAAVVTSLHDTHDAQQASAPTLSVQRAG